MVGHKQSRPGQRNRRLKSELSAFPKSSPPEHAIHDLVNADSALKISGFIGAQSDITLGSLHELLRHL